MAAPHAPEEGKKAAAQYVSRIQAVSERTLSIVDASTMLKSKGITGKGELLKSLADEMGIIDIRNVMSGPPNALSKVLTSDIAVPDWAAFTSDLTKIFDAVQAEVHSGKCADYIPILAEQDPNWFSVSVCTVDGQRFDLGNIDQKHKFSIQSCVKPLLYAAAVEEHGLKRLHRHVGIEPSGLSFNEVSLNSNQRPHNPLINSGAIVTGSMCRNDLDMAARFRAFNKLVEDMAGGQKPGFSQPTYLCEMETAWRNNALMYFMKAAGVFPRNSSPDAALDFYIQACSINVNSSIAASVAATFAAGGENPITGKRVLSPVTVKSALTLMFSCGMYDYSGEWCVSVGLPAKSGVAGLVYIVVPTSWVSRCTVRPWTPTATACVASNSASACSIPTNSVSLTRS